MCGLHLCCAGNITFLWIDMVLNVIVSLTCVLHIGCVLVFSSSRSTHSLPHSYCITSALWFLLWRIHTPNMLQSKVISVMVYMRTMVMFQRRRIRCRLLQAWYRMCFNIYTFDYFTHGMHLQNDYYAWYWWKVLRALRPTGLIRNVTRSLVILLYAYI